MATRVTLLHNPSAGFEDYSTEQLLKILREKGFEPTYVPTFLDDYTDELKEPGDLVVIAGGDGTVGKIAVNLVQRGIPIGLLPMGTANNIATTLGIKGKPEAIIAGWDLSRRQSFDVGVLNGPAGETFFLESAGFGLFPRLIRQREQDDTEKKSREEELTDALEHQKEILYQYQSHTCRILADGQSIAGNYLLIEVMNIALAGPNMNLAPQADVGDGWMDLVLVQETEREQFVHFLENILRNQENQHQLTTRRVKELEVEWHSPHYHVDDQALEEKIPVRITIKIIPKGLEFLV